MFYCKKNNVIKEIYSIYLYMEFKKWFDTLSRFCKEGSVEQMAKKLLPSECKHLPLDKDLYFTAFCSDWNGYENDPTRPVIFLEAHMDTVQKEFIQPYLDSNKIHGTGLDNRVSCAILNKFVRNIGSSFNRTPGCTKCILYVLWTDGEETGMVGIHEWFNKYYISHDKDWFVILDITDRAGKEASGKGTFYFQDDPIDTILEVIRPLPFIEQVAPFIYPSNLEQTHASRCYAKLWNTLIDNPKHRVSRLGIPVIDIHELDSCVSLNDVMALYNKLCLATYCIGINLCKNRY
jgi:hypothetical protein